MEIRFFVQHSTLSPSCDGRDTHHVESRGVTKSSDTLPVAAVVQILTLVHVSETAHQQYRHSDVCCAVWSHTHIPKDSSSTVVRRDAY